MEIYYIEAGIFDRMLGCVESLSTPWTGCMRKMRIKGLVSDWTVRMSACALTFLPVPCRPFVIPDGWRSPRFSVNFITNRKMWRG